MAEDWMNEINGGDDEEEALRIAIAMSLGEDPKREASAEETPVVDLTGADDAENTGLPSTGDSTASTESGNVEKQSPAQEVPGVQAAPPANTLAALGLDRKKMEEERLMRLRKRKAPESDDIGPSPPRQRAKPEPAKTRAAEGGGATHHTSQPKSASVAMPFAKGVVKKTWLRGYPRTGDDITFEEVLQKEHVELAVLSSFQWDDDWLLSKVNLGKTKLILIAFAADDAQVRWKRETPYSVAQGERRFMPSTLPRATRDPGLWLF